MLITAIVLFVIAALLGLTVAVQLFRRRPTSKGVAVAHGLVAAAGLVVVLIEALRSPQRFLTTAIVLLVIAALGGAVLFVNDLRAKPGPLALIVIHALVALAAVVLVIVVVA